MFKAIVFILCLLMSSCRSSQPPKFDLFCILNGFGISNCLNPDGKYPHQLPLPDPLDPKHFPLLPSETKDMIVLKPSDFANFSAWCYQTSPSVTAPIIHDLTTAMKENQRNEPKTYR